MEGAAFLGAISAAPREAAPRLVYADWLEERGDPRYDFVRVQARLLEPCAADERAALEERERELRPGLPARWLAQLDPPVWCVAGNVALERPQPDGAAPIRGTRLFRPNAKVYLAGWRHAFTVLADPARAWSSVTVVGQHRKSRQWIGCYVRPAALANWRVELVRHPGALVCLRKYEWPGFRLPPGDFAPAEGAERSEAIRALLAAIEATWRR